MANTWVGISGWTFDGWKKTFYPDGLAVKKQLEFASRQVNSIEINGTFYALQKPSSFETWYRSTPGDFTFAVKAPQFITHILRLKDAEEPLANFFASGLLCLKEKLGPILWQFPPHVMLKDDRFEKFIKLLPHDAKSAGELASRHGSKVEGRSHLDTTGISKVRHAFEFRHKSFLNPDFIAFLREHHIAFVFAHGGGEKAPYTEEPTSDFVYARLHGEGKAYANGYPAREISRWAKKVSEWKNAGLDTYVYFSNEAKVYSPDGAMQLLKKLGVERLEKANKAA